MSTRDTPVVHILGLNGEMAALLRQGRGQILCAIAGGWFLSIGVRLAYPVLLPYFQTAYDLDLTTAGLLLSTLWLAYAFGQLPGGVFSDRIGERNVFIISTVLSGVTLLLVMIADSMLVLFLATALFGLSTALYGVARFTALSAIFPDNDGKAVGITLAAGEVGNAVLPLLIGFVAATFTWQYGISLSIPLFAVAATALWVAMPAGTTGETSAVDRLSLETVRYIGEELLQPAVVVVTSIQILTYCIWQAFTGFYPIYLIEIKGLSPTFATGLFSVFFGFGIVVQPVAGWIYDRFGIQRSLPALLSVIAVSLAMVPWLQGLWTLVAGTVFLSSILGYGTMTLPYITTALPEDMRGTGLGALRTFYMTVGSVSPVLFGAAADRGFFDEGFLVMSVLAVVTILLCTQIPR